MAASTSFSISALPTSPTAIRSRQIPAAITLERDPESSPEDRFPDPLQKLYMGVLEGWLKDIVREGTAACQGLTAEELRDWQGLCLDIGLPGDTVPRMIARGLEMHQQRVVGKKVRS